MKKINNIIQVCKKEDIKVKYKIRIYICKTESIRRKDKNVRV